ncbi:hypothetical protein RI367_008246 [Sorochytrium milnesiophthora]
MARLLTTASMSKAYLALATQHTTPFIGGRFVAPPAHIDAIHLVNPFNDDYICAVERSAAVHLEQAVHSAALLGIADVIDANQELLAYTETLQSGKLYRDSLEEVAESAECFRYFAGWTDKINGRTQALPGMFSGRTVVGPRGICAIITSFNYPFLLMSWKLAPALAAGNAVIVKPAPTTPLSALHLARLSADILPPGCLSVLPGDAHIGTLVTQHPAVAMVSFTGSTEVGRRIVAEAAESNMKKVVCELGGKNTAIVDKDVDLNSVADILIGASFANAGQNCCAASRYLLHEAIYHDFMDVYRAKVNNMRFGDPYDDRTSMGGLATVDQKVKLIERLAVLGDVNTNHPGGASNVEHRSANDEHCRSFVPPIVLTGVADNHPLAQQELFGPAVTVLEPWSDIVQAVRRANNTEYGLAGGIFSSDTANVNYFVQNMQAGNLWVNTWNYSPVYMPFGGLKLSGNGKELGWEGLSEYTTVKSVVAAE